MTALRVSPEAARIHRVLHGQDHELHDQAQPGAEEQQYAHDLALAVAAAVLLDRGILPAQRRLLPGRPHHVSAPAAPGGVVRSARRLAMYTGMFNLL